MNDVKDLSLEDLALIFKTILGADNDLRPEAEKHLVSFRENQSDKFVVYCFTLLKESNDTIVRSSAAVALRKNLSAYSEKSYKCLWDNLNPQTKDFVKQQLLITLENEQDDYIRKLISEAIGEIGGSLVPSEDSADTKKMNEWPELIPSIFQMLAHGNEKIMEAALRIMTSIFTYTFVEFLEFKSEVLMIFKNALNHDSPSIQTRCIEAFASWLAVIQSKHLKPFEEIIPMLCKSILIVCQKDEDLAEEALSAFSDMMEHAPKFFNKSFKPVWEMVTTIMNSKTIEDAGLKQIALEIAVLFAEGCPNVIENNSSALNEFLELIFLQMIEVEAEDLEAWSRPPEGYNQDFEDEDDLVCVKFGMKALDRVIDALSKKVIFPPLTGIVQQMLGHSDWRYQHAALMALSQIGEYMEEIEDIDPVVKLVINFCENPHPRIRFASFHVFGQLADDMAPDFEDTYSETLIPLYIRCMDDPVPRVKSHILAGLTNLLESTVKSTTVKYMDELLKKMFTILDNGISIVKENALTAITAVAESANEAYLPYYHDSMPIIYNILKNMTTKPYKQLRGQAIEAITLMSKSVGWEHFSRYAPDVVNTMIEIQDSQLDEIDPQKSYLIAGWQRLCLLMENEILPYMPRIIPTLFKMVKEVFSNVDNENDETEDEMFGGNKLVSKQDNQSEIQKQKENYQTCDTETADVAINMLLVFIECLRGNYADFVEDTIMLILPLVNYSTNDNLRSSAAKTLSGLLDCIKESNKEGKEHALSKLIKVFTAQVWKAILEEYNPDIITTQIYALRDCVLSIDERFMTQQELDETTNNIIKVLSLSHERKADVKEQLQEEEEVEEVEIKAAEEDTKLEEQLHVAMAEYIGSLFKTHKEMTLPFVDLLYNQVLTKVLDPSLSDRMHQFGLFLIDDMIEFLGIELIPDKWPHLSEALVKYAYDQTAYVRQAAVFGIGVLAEKSREIFGAMAQDCLNALLQALTIPKGDTPIKHYGHARSNTIAALGKIIKAHPDKIDLPPIVNAWVNALPMTNDKVEALGQHEFLCDLIISDSNIILGDNLVHLPKIVTVFADILETRFCNDKIAGKIKTILNQMLTQETFKNALYQIVGGLSQNRSDKLKNLLEG